MNVTHNYPNPLLRSIDGISISKVKFLGLRPLGYQAPLFIKISKSLFPNFPALNGHFYNYLKRLGYKINFLADDTDNLELAIYEVQKHKNPIKTLINQVLHLNNEEVKKEPDAKTLKRVLEAYFETEIPVNVTCEVFR